MSHCPCCTGFRVSHPQGYSIGDPVTCPGCQSCAEKEADIVKLGVEFYTRLAEKDKRIAELELSVRAGESAEHVLNMRIAELEEELSQAQRALGAAH